MPGTGPRGSRRWRPGRSTSPSRGRQLQSLGLHASILRPCGRRRAGTPPHYRYCAGIFAPINSHKPNPGQEPRHYAGCDATQDPARRSAAGGVGWSSPGRPSGAPPRSDGGGGAGAAESSDSAGHYRHAGRLEPRRLPRLHAGIQKSGRRLRVGRAGSRMVGRARSTTTFATTVRRPTRAEPCVSSIFGSRCWRRTPPSSSAVFSWSGRSIRSMGSTPGSCGGSMAIG